MTTTGTTSLQLHDGSKAEQHSKRVIPPSPEEGPFTAAAAAPPPSTPPMPASALRTSSSASAVAAEEIESKRSTVSFQVPPTGTGMAVDDSSTNREDSTIRRGRNIDNVYGSEITSSDMTTTGGDDWTQPSSSSQRQPPPPPQLPPPPPRRKTRRNIKRSGSQVFLPRLITRDLDFQQSRNRVHVQNKMTFQKVARLVAMDWFHVLLRLPGYVAITSLLLIWVMMLLVFAAIYRYVDRRNFEQDCGLGDPGEPIAFATGFAFSLETATTVGYGLPGSTTAFFNAGCQGVQVAIFFQMVWSMLFNAFIFAFFYSQLSKSETRSIQLVFSDKLVLTERNGKVYAEVRCYDLDSACPLVEAHARMYLLDHKLKLTPLRISDPNDDLGAMMYPSIPQVISHQVDSHSALAPRRLPLMEPDHGLTLRSVDSATANREEIICPVCGEGYGTYERLMQHMTYQRIVEIKDEYPVEGTHRGFVMPDDVTPITLEEVKDHVERKLSEIIVVVEAIDPQLSGTFQSVQSYKYENIEFGADFEQCLFVRNDKFTVDMTLFHGIVLDDDYHHCHQGDDGHHHQSSIGGDDDSQIAATSWVGGDLISGQKEEESAINDDDQKTD